MDVAIAATCYNSGLRRGTEAVITAPTRNRMVAEMRHAGSNPALSAIPIVPGYHPRPQPSPHCRPARPSFAIVPIARGWCHCQQATKTVEQACTFTNVMDRTTKDKLAEIGNIEVHQCDDGYPFTAPAMRFKPNRFGLHDMIGNAWEWVEDCGGGDNYARAPTDGRAATLGSCHFRVLRGASWLSPPRETCSAARSTGVALLRSSGTGFRLARPVP